MKDDKAFWIIAAIFWFVVAIMLSFQGGIC
jgi:hypothetical protein